MREIKFRAWDVKNQSMMILTDYSWMTQASDGRSLPVSCNIEAYFMHGINRGAHKRYYDRDDLILLQYTGLKDKNGKEIYEGDIVKCDGGTLPAEVVWFSENGSWALETHNPGTRNNPFELYYFGESEVIGNIYETHELLNP